MLKPEYDWYYIKRGKRRDEELHSSVLDDGDHAKAKQISDQVARKVGLTAAEIAALNAPPKKTTGKPK